MGLEYNFTKTNVVDGFPYDAQFHRFYDFPVMPMDFGRSISRFGVPLNLRWHYQKGKWGFSGLTGVVATVNHLRQYTFNEQYIDNETYHYLQEQDFKGNLGLGITAGVGVEYSIKPNWLLRAEPRFRVYNVAKATPENYRFYHTQPQQPLLGGGLERGRVLRVWEVKQTGFMLNFTCGYCHAPCPM